MDQRGKKMSRRNDSVCTKVAETLEMIEACRGPRCDWMLDCCVLIRKERGGGRKENLQRSRSRWTCRLRLMMMSCGINP